jgi:uncharacterized protein
VTLRGLVRRGAVLPIAAYRALLSPLLPPSCIYSPTCSAYAQAAILKHGILAGTLLALARVARCTPALFQGGEDHVPEAFSFGAVRDGYRRFRRTRRSGPGRES